MNANELRYNNLIFYKGGIIPVTLIGEFGIQSNHNGILINAKFATPDLIPIPLTTEWLLKFGFFYSESLDMYLLKIETENWICWDKEKGITMQDVNRVLFEYKKIKYVHQLQNLYFATKQEELKLKQP